ncbi:hypothetical protein [Streptomyces sp. NPDC001642]
MTPSRSPGGRRGFRPALLELALTAEAGADALTADDDRIVRCRS